MTFISLYILKKRIFAIKPMMKDPAVSKWKKTLVIVGLIYLILPFDLIPPMIPVFGFLDDFVLWAFILSYLKDELDKYWDSSPKGQDYASKFKKKNIIDNVEFTVEDEEEESSQHDTK